MQVLNFGSINIDYVYQVPHFVRPGETLAAHQLDKLLGGKGANQSVALSRAGVEVKHAGAVNKADQWVLDQLKDSGVDTTHVTLMDDPSGHAIIQVDANGENSILLFGGANRTHSLEYIESVIGSMTSGDWLLLQNECNGNLEAIQAARKYGLKVAFNPAPMTPEVEALPLQEIDLIFLNEVEACDLSGQTCGEMAFRTLAARHPNLAIVMTQGAKGASLAADDEITMLPAPEVTAVDSTGAGDTFVGYFLASLIQDLSYQEALARAIAASAIAVTRHGASTSIPMASEVK